MSQNVTEQSLSEATSVHDGTYHPTLSTWRPALQEWNLHAE